MFHTIQEVLAVITPVVIGAVGIYLKVLRKGQQEIHVLVNARLTEALSEIESLKRRLDAKDNVIAEQDKQRGA